MKEYLLEIRKPNGNIIHKPQLGETETGAIIDYYKSAPEGNKVIAISALSFRKIEEEA